jgi:hypothetical protein
LTTHSGVSFQPTPLSIYFSQERTMTKGKAFACVGHKNWGKSKTLLALTDGRLLRSFSINSNRFIVRRMSNDDRPKPFYEFLKGLRPKAKPLVILALCPTFEDDKKRKKLIRYLNRLKRDYQIFFFVLQSAYKGDKRISPEEIASLEWFGTVKVFSHSKSKMQRRGKAFRRFITQNLV